MYYVIQKNSKDNTQELLGFNLSKEEKDKLFYSLGKNQNSAMGDDTEGDGHIRNSYGSHKIKFKNAIEAFDELIIKPDAFNNALELLQKAGYDVVKKGIVSTKQKVVSYQMEKSNIF